MRRKEQKTIAATLLDIGMDHQLIEIITNIDVDVKNNESKSNK